MLVSKRAVFEICSEKKTRESITGNFKNICAVTVHCWYKQDAFAGFREQIFEKKKFRRHFRVDKNNLSRLADLAIRLCVCVLGRGCWALSESVKKQNLRWKSFSDNVEWSSKKL